MKDFLRRLLFALEIACYFFGLSRKGDIVYVSRLLTDTLVLIFISEPSPTPGSSAQIAGSPALVSCL
jgi:hypothetical protein